MVAGTPTTVILLTIDCLRADTARTMPTLSALADDHVDVADCHSVGSGTPTSMPGFMQSRLPTDHGAQPKASRLVKGVPTLAETLSDVGVRTGGWHSNIYTSRNYNYNRGFDVFADLDTHPPDTPGDLAENDTDHDAGGAGTRTWVDYAEAASQRLGIEAVAERVYHTLRNQGLVDGRPSVEAEAITDALTGFLPDEADETTRFAWGHFMDLHNPYLPPREYRERVHGCPVSKRAIWPINEKVNNRPQDLTPGEVEDLKSLYVAAAHYADDQLARLVDELKTRGLWEETLLVVSADHGEMFDDRPIPDDLPFKHPNYVCEEITHVPLVLAGGTVDAETITHVASGMDVPVTILDALGISTPDTWSGLPIGSPAFEQRDRVYSVTGRGTRQDKTVGEVPEDVLHVGLRTDETAALWWSGAALPPEFYTRTRDGEELNSANRVPEATSLLQSIEARFNQDARRFTDHYDHGDHGLDDRSTDRLRQLGYIE